MSIFTRAPHLYLKDVTIPSEQASELVSTGALLPVHLTWQNNGVQKSSSTRLLIENPKAVCPEHKDSSHELLLKYVAQSNFPILLKSLGLFPTPQVNLYNQADESFFDSHNEVAIVLGPDSKKRDWDSASQISLCVNLPNDRQLNIVDLQVLWLSKERISQFVYINRDHRPVKSFPIAALKALKKTGMSSQSLIEMQRKLENFDGIQPTPISYFILMPNRYFETANGMDTLIRNYSRNISLIKSSEQLLNLLETYIKVAFREPCLKNIHNAIPRLRSLHKYVQSNATELDLHLQKEYMELSSVSMTGAYQIRHYEKVVMTVLSSQISGLIRIDPHSWSSSTSLSINPDEKNSFFHNLLPEPKEYENTKSPIAKLETISSLVSNFTIQPIFSVEVCRSIYEAMPQISESVLASLKSPNNPRYFAPCVTYHNAKLSNEVLYKGYFEGIPSLDPEFSTVMAKLMESEYGAKLSGAQFKLPMSLSINQIGERELFRQSGNRPFTHIAKFPMPGLSERITLSEWLGLSLLKKVSLIPISKFQLASFQKNVGEQTLTSPEKARLNQSSLDNLRDMVEETLSDNRSTTSQNNRFSPPFLLSERFDVTEEGSQSKIVARDFACLLRQGPDEKYNSSLESIGIWIQENIHDERERKQISLNVFLQAVCSMIVHNNDLHLKNLTLLEVFDPKEGKSKFQMAPVYDVLVTPLVISTNPAYKQALYVNQSHFPSLEDYVVCGNSSFGLSREFADSLITDTIERFKKVVSHMKSELPLEIEQNAAWRDSVLSGLQVVARNIEHLEQNRCSFAHERNLSIMHTM